MTGADQIVDITIDPAQQRRQRRRAAMRVGLPIVGVALVILTIAAIAIQTTKANQEGVLALTDDLLASLQERVSLQVAHWLEPAQHALLTARDLAGQQGATENHDLATRYAATTLRREPEIAQFSFADGDGNFLLVRRGNDGGTDVKTIHMAPPPRETIWTHLDATSHEIGREADPKDDYDPRTRPWFTGAVASKDVFWTPVYMFFTDKTPGITAAIRVPGAAGRTDVVGVDIYLRDLAGFLASLSIGKTGEAAIVDRSGAPIAATAKLDQALLASAWDRYRLEGPGYRIIDADGRRIVTMVEPLKVSGVDWALVVIVPADEFTGFLVAHNRTALLMSAIIVGMALVLAVLLVRQGIRADRLGRVAGERATLLAAQSAAYGRLATEAGSFGPDGKPPHGMTEILSETTGARRASLWRIAAGGGLRCLDMYEQAGHGHTEDLELARQEVPRFIAALLAGAPVTSRDAATDARFAEFYRAVMQPFGSRSGLAVPIHHGGTPIGAIVLEDAIPRPDIADFAAAVAAMVALGIAETAAEPIREVGPSGHMPEEDPEEVRSHTVELTAARQPPPARDFANVTVAVFRFSDPRSDDMRHVLTADSIACALQEIAETHRIPYVKILGEEVIAAAGFTGSDHDATTRVAEATLDMRDRCAALFEDADLPPTFRIGMDCGAATGSEIGREPRIFNLWGESVRMAIAMAASAPGTGIQVTEAAYHRLNRHYLLRPRGSFYMPRVGAAQSFILAGRL